MRECWLYYYFSDRCGDDGWAFRQYDEIRKFNYQGEPSTSRVKSPVSECTSECTWST
jgi:hypothetical protein